MKIIVVGCTHTGTAAINGILDRYKDAEITVYEINDNISFLSCGIAMCVDKTVSDINNFFYSSPSQLRELGVNVNMEHEVTDIDFDNKQIQVVDLNNNLKKVDTYDKLIISTGSWPIELDIPGKELENVLLCKNFKHASTIINKSVDAKKVAVIGGGYIGMELAEAYAHLGKEVTLIDFNPVLLGKYVDSEFSEQITQEVLNNNINLALGQKVESLEGEGGKVTKVITDKDTFEVDTVIMAVGFKPNTKLVQGKLDTLGNGAVIVDKYMRTSDENVFAGGDAVTLDYNPDRTKSYLPLATNAIRTGAIIARNIKENVHSHPGTNATSSIKVFDYNISTTGLTEAECIKRGIEVESVLVEDNHLFEFVDGSEKQALKVVYEKESRRVVGAQYITKAFLPQTINVISMAIHTNQTIDDLAYADFYFLPHFNKVWNIINLAGLKALR